jgi:hypothetical protein
LTGDAASRAECAAIADPKSARARPDLTKIEGAAEDDLIDRLLSAPLRTPEHVLGTRLDLLLSEQQAVGDCRSPEGVIVGLIDGIIASSRIVAAYLLTGQRAEAVTEALADARSDNDVLVVTSGRFSMTEVGDTRGPTNRSRRSTK